MLSSIAGITSETKNIFSGYTCCFQRMPRKLYLKKKKKKISGLSISLCVFFAGRAPQREHWCLLDLSEGRLQDLSITKVCESGRHCNSARRCPGGWDLSSIKWNYLHVVMRIHLIPCTTYFRFLPFFGEVGEGESHLAVASYADYP